MKAVTAARLGLRPGGAGRWNWRPLLGVAAVLAVGVLLIVALSLPATLVPGTRVGSMLAGALIAGALVGRGKAPLVRAASGGLMGLLLGAAISVVAWGLMSDAPDAAVWQVTGLNIMANSNIPPVDQQLRSWIGGYDQLEGHLLYVRFAVSNLLLGLLGGLVGGLLASGNPRAPVDAAAPENESVGEGPPADAAETAEDPGEGPEAAPPAEAAEESGGDAEDMPPNDDGV